LSLECLHNRQPRAYCPACIIFMGSRIAKVDQQSIPQILREVAVMSLDHLSAGLLILLHDRPVVLGIELGGEGSGTYQVAEHHRELPALSFLRRRARLLDGGRDRTPWRFPSSEGVFARASFS